MDGGRRGRMVQGRSHLCRNEGAELDWSRGVDSRPSVLLSIPARYTREEPGLATDPGPSWGSRDLGKEFELLSLRPLV